MMSIIDFDHINIRTANVTAMTSFYAEVLGLEEGWRPDFSFPGAWLYLCALSTLPFVRAG
jgi:catechol 2,3-dioxygenase-like lactoylglutathione lyase family enzyme